jgi:hypothetical protein
MLKVSSHDDTYAGHILILSYFSHYPSHAVLVIRYGGPRHVRLITVHERDRSTRSQIQNPSELKKQRFTKYLGVGVYQSLSLLGTSQHLPTSPSISQHLPTQQPAAPRRDLPGPLGLVVLQPEDHPEGTVPGAGSASYTWISSAEMLRSGGPFFQ